MKTNESHQRRSQLALCLMLFMLASWGHGAVNTFTNRTEWTRTVRASTVLIGFELPAGTAISNQFAGPGFEFVPETGGFPIVLDYVTNHVLSTPLVPNTGQMIRMRFTRPVIGVGWDRTSDNDTHFYRIFDVNNVEIGTIDFRTPTQSGGPIFGGFTSDVPIGFASSFSDNNDQLHSIDNLIFAPVPEPSTGTLVALGLLAGGIFARRRNLDFRF